MIQLIKKPNIKTQRSMLVVVDDLADDPVFIRQSKLLHAPHARGRHNSISTNVSTKKGVDIHPVLRVSETSLMVYRLKS